MFEVVILACFLMGAAVLILCSVRNIAYYTVPNIARYTMFGMHATFVLLSPNER
jgi:hypothetical protein